MFEHSRDVENVWSKIKTFYNVIWMSIYPSTGSEVVQSWRYKVDNLNDTMPAISAIWKMFQMTIDGGDNPFIPYEVMLEGI